MATITPEWFDEKEYDHAISRRLGEIVFWRDEILKSQKQIERLETEVQGIKESRAQYLELKSKSGDASPTHNISRGDYNPQWTWFEKAYFILKWKGEFCSAKDIVMYLVALDTEVRESDHNKRRKIQSAITNTLNARVEKKSIITITDQEAKVKKYGLPEWGTIQFAPFSLV